LAILEIDAKDLPVVDLGDSDELKIGQTAIAIGNALGRFQNTVTVGVVSGIARELQASSGFGSLKTYEGVIQTDAALNPGNSGGPLLNSAGQVVGINVATSLGADNISFAIPINDLKPILEAFLRDGKITRPYMGVVYTLISRDISRLRRLPEGAYISRVLPDAPADKAGIERGDIIVKIDGDEVTTTNSLANIIAQKQVGDTIEVEVDRDGEAIFLGVILGEAEEE
jgi:S1-C subfamily serine protease